MTNHELDATAQVPFGAADHVEEARPVRRAVARRRLLEQTVRVELLVCWRARNIAYDGKGCCRQLAVV